MRRSPAMDSSVSEGSGGSERRKSASEGGPLHRDSHRLRSFVARASGSTDSSSTDYRHSVCSSGRRAMPSS